MLPRRLWMVRGAFVLCFAFARPASAQQQASRTYYSYCYSEPIHVTTPGPLTRYYSGVFADPDPAQSIIPPAQDPLAAGRPDGGTAARGRLAWTVQFNEFLVKMYSFPTSVPVTCEAFNTPEQAQQRLDSLKQYERGAKNGIIETGWKYVYVPGQAIPGADPCYTPPTQHRITNVAPGCAAGGTSAPTAPAVSGTANPPPPAPKAATPSPATVAAPIAPAEQGVPYAVCWGESAGLKDPTAYFSAPFDGAVKNVAGWSKAYKEVLVSKYKFAGALHCNVFNSLAEAQQHIQTTGDSLRSSHKIVETGWKYQ